MLHKASKKRTATPELGIFWIDDSGTMFSESISLRDAEDYGEFKIFDGSHFESWADAVRANPKWRDKEYEEIPRGRVVCKKNPKKPEFIVYLPKRIGKYKKRVIARFKLPSSHVRFDMSDEHYRI
jgi:hypothetical protein